jgi:hypothetical protein
MEDLSLEANADFLFNLNEVEAAAAAAAASSSCADITPIPPIPYLIIYFFTREAEE